MEAAARPVTFPGSGHNQPGGRAVPRQAARLQLILLSSMEVAVPREQAAGVGDRLTVGPVWASSQGAGTSASNCAGAREFAIQTPSSRAFNPRMSKIRYALHISCRMVYSFHQISKGSTTSKKWGGNYAWNLRV